MMPGLGSVWFVLVAVLLTGYILLDGFDLGVGILHLFTREEQERRVNLEAIGPVWDGNEVWLVTGGGALFAAFPPVYATAVSALYSAVVLLLLALIFRAVSLEFRGRIDSASWKKAWDYAFGGGSFVAALLLGVAVGNVLRGLPIDESGRYLGTFFALLNPYALLFGITAVVLMTLHGISYMVLKSSGKMNSRLFTLVPFLWKVLVVLLVCVLGLSYFMAADGLIGVSKPLFWVFSLILVFSVIRVPGMAKRSKERGLFISTSGIIVGGLGMIAVTLFPVLLPSSISYANGLSISNSSSSQYTLGVMTCIAGIGMPIVIAYTSYVYWHFRGKVQEDNMHY